MTRRKGGRQRGCLDERGSRDPATESGFTRRTRGTSQLEGHRNGSTRAGAEGKHKVQSKSLVVPISLLLQPADGHKVNLREPKHQSQFQTRVSHAS